MAKGSIVLEEGWKRVEPRREKGGGEGQDDRQALPSLEEGQVLQVNKMELVEKETQPPKPYNDATLLAAMKNAGRDIEDDALAEAMKQSGLGTSATRAEIIEKLIRTGYVQRARKQLCSTEKGQALIGLVAKSLRSPELTAEWEQQLKEVEEGIQPAEGFYRNIVEFVQELVPKIAEGPALSPEQRAAAQVQRKGRRAKGSKRSGSQPAGLGKCPLCKEGEIVETAKAYGCSRYREGCKFTIWRTVAGRKLTKRQIEQLLQTGGTERIEGFTSKAGKPFAARLKLGEAFQVELDFADGPHRGAVPESGAAPDRESNAAARQVVPGQGKDQSTPPGLLTCPKCGQGRIIEGKRGFGCNRFRAGCDFVVWKEIAGKRLTEKQIHDLTGKGKTRLIKGFTGRSGKKFDARLRLDEQWKVVFEFPDFGRPGG